VNINDCSGIVIDAAMKVHSTLGPGLLERPYVICLTHELRSRGLQVLNQLGIPVIYDGICIDLGYRIDLLVNGVLVVEVKAAAALAPVHHAQVLSYLRLGGYKLGLLINFNVRHLRDGIERIVNRL
jgi:GxxExxY protein